MGRKLKKSEDPYANRIQEMRLKTGLNRREFCEQFDIPYRTVSDWESGQRHAPEYVIRLLEYYLRFEGYSGEDTAETSGAPPQQGEYTRKDYDALPGDVRAELMDGSIYVMEAPSSRHQILVVEICHQLRTFIETQGGDSMVLASPLHVQPDGDDRTILQPDVMVVCDRGKITREGVCGAPDLVMEITSASTKSRDMVLKLHKYLSAGVREYWVIDPEKKRIMVYDLTDKDADLSLYGFDDTVPVGLFGGECVLDFRKIYDDMRFLYET